jgi:hypothetical protein
LQHLQRNFLNLLTLGSEEAMSTPLPSPLVPAAEPQASAAAPVPASSARASDGWLGTPQLPAYRLGQVVVRLADLPEVDAEHLYFHLLWMGDGGTVLDDHSGPCEALPRSSSIEQRAHFVRVVCELVRHAPAHDQGLAAMGQALTHIRRFGVDGERLMLAAQLLDAAASEAAVVASLADLLTQALGSDAALLETQAVLQQHSLRKAGREPPPPVLPVPRAAAQGTGAEAELVQPLTLLLRRVGKARVRRCLIEATDLPLLPQADLLRS